MKFYKIIFVITFSLFVSTGCNDSDPLNYNQETDTDLITEPNEDEAEDVTDIVDTNKIGHEEAQDYTYDSSNITEITLNGNSITVNGNGASENGSTVTITNAGTYRITGSLTDGQIIVNSEDSEKVQLLFNGINVNCSYNAPIYINESDKTVIILEENTHNYVSDGETYEASEEDANAALFSKDDLSISGAGTLTVTANYNDAITSKDGLIINSGTYVVNSIDDGVRGKDYLIINDGNFTLNVEGDGLKSDNDSEVDKGFITINDIEINAVSGNDAIQADTNILIYYGEFNLTSGGGNNAYLASDTSAKGIKAGTNIAIEDGIFEINSADDAIHSNNSILINDGTFNITSGDDGIHSDEVLEINGGNINVTKSYEGIESADITINNGTIHLTASDDGLNVAGGVDNSGYGGRGGHAAGNYRLYINGGHIVVDAKGDGIDVNGSIEMVDGTVIVNGPNSGANGPLDYDGYFKSTGGFVVAVGTSNMAQTISTSSTQYGVLAKFSTQQANQMINVQSNSGVTIFSFVPTKSYQSIAFTSPKLEKGTTYNMYFGGSSTGENTDGLYLDGTYTAGTKVSSFTISNIVTTAN